jgi:hypothetical protein
MLGIEIAGKEGERKWSVLAVVSRWLQRRKTAKKSMNLFFLYTQKKCSQTHVTLETHRNPFCIQIFLETCIAVATIPRYGHMAFWAN